MNKIILFCFLLLLTLSLASAQVSHYYKLDLVYNSGNISIQSLSVVSFSSKPEQVEGRYIAEIVSSKNEILNLTFFAVSTFKIVTYLDPKTNQMYDKTVYINQSFTTVYVPYFEDAVQLNIYDWNLTRKLTVDLSSFSKTEVSNLFISPSFENKSLNFSQISKTESSSKNFPFLPLFISLGVILILFLLYFIFFRKRIESK